MEMNLKDEFLALLEKAKTELHQAVDAVTADIPNYLEALASVAEKHQAVQTIAQVLAKL